MEARLLPKLLNVLCIPFTYLLSLIGGRITDRHLVSRTIDENLLDSKNIPLLFVSALVEAEDRRFFIHRGIDIFAILRAVKVNLSERPIQGASTIEQQLVRTITARRERTYTRKLREVCLALWLSAAYDKPTIAKVYLTLAYYGFEAAGLDDACRYFRVRRSAPSIRDAALVVAHIRYPLPRVHTSEAVNKISRRAEWVVQRLLASSRQAQVAHDHEVGIAGLGW